MAHLRATHLSGSGAGGVARRGAGVLAWEPAMEAKAVPLLTLLQNTPQFTIPIWQRTYSWTERECRRLWDDILRAGSDDNVQAHFINSIVYVQENALYMISGRNPMLVIDGQQRLTTTMLILEALARHIGDEEPVPDFSAEKIRNWYLIVPENSGDRRFKLVLTQTDKEALFALLDEKTPQLKESIRITENFDFFRREIKNVGDSAIICKGLAKLKVVDIALERGRDDPQLIFESMNSTGLDLTQSDLIRNYILMGLSTNDQNRLYENHWRQMEILFGQREWKRFDGFMGNYLALKTGEIPQIKKVYDAFKFYASSVKTMDELIADIHKYAKYYCNIALDQERDPDLLHAFRDIRELKGEASFPFLLDMYDDHTSGNLEKTEFISAIRLVESYVFRRLVCGMGTDRRTFATFGRSIQKDDYLNSIRQHFHSLPTPRHFPADEKFKELFIEREMYPLQGRSSYWLRRLENHDRKEPISINQEGGSGKYSVEHILPQTRNLSPAWRDMLGGNWPDVQERYLHTVGNLTLTGYNSEYGARPFNEKRDMEGGFKDSPLRLNRGLGTLERWDAGTIQQRGRELAERAVKVWPPLTTK